MPDNILDDPAAEILVRAPLPTGGYRETWVSLATLDARTRQIAVDAIAAMVVPLFRLQQEHDRERGIVRDFVPEIPSV